MNEVRKWTTILEEFRIATGLTVNKYKSFYFPTVLEIYTKVNVIIFFCEIFSTIIFSKGGSFTEDHSTLGEGLIDVVVVKGTCSVRNQT